MNTLQSLVHHCIRRIKPICAYKIEKNKKRMKKFMATSGLISLVSLLSSLFLDTNLNLNKSIQDNGFLGLILIVVFGCGAALSVWSFLELRECTEEYNKLINYDDTFNGVREVIYKYSGEDDTLTVEETQALLNMDFSEKNIGILHTAISIGGYLIFDELLNLYEQQQQENEAVENQAKFIENGAFNTSKQQNNLAQIAAINGVKTNYKTFNSKSVL